MPLVYKVEEMLTALGLVVFAVTTRKSIKDDGTVVDERVAVIPDISSYSLYVELNEDNELVVTAESNASKKQKLIVVPSTMCAGPQEDGMTIKSDLGALLRPWRELCAIEALTTHAYEDNIFPPVYLQRQLPRADAPSADLLKQQYAEVSGNITSRLMPRSEEDDSEMRLKRIYDLDISLDDIKRICPVDPILAQVNLPPNYIVAVPPRPAVIPTDLTERRVRFETNVASAVKIPESYMTSAKTGAINGKQNTTASDNDKKQYKDTVDALQLDVTHVLRVIYTHVHGHVPEVHLPVASDASLEDTLSLYLHGFIDADGARLIAARATGIHKAHLTRGKIKVPTHTLPEKQNVTL